MDYGIPYGEQPMDMMLQMQQAYIKGAYDQSMHMQYNVQSGNSGTWFPNTAVSDLTYPPQVLYDSGEVSYYDSTGQMLYPSMGEYHSWNLIDEYVNDQYNNIYISFFYQHD